MKYEIRQLDAWKYEDDWTVNTSYFLGTMKTNARDEKRAFSRFLRKQGIRFKRGRTRIVFDGDFYTVEDRKTSEPFFIAVPIF